MQRNYKSGGEKDRDWYKKIAEIIVSWAIESLNYCRRGWTSINHSPKWLITRNLRMKEGTTKTQFKRTIENLINLQELLDNKWLKEWNMLISRISKLKKLVHHKEQNIISRSKIF